MERVDNVDKKLTITKDHEKNPELTGSMSKSYVNAHFHKGKDDPDGAKCA